MKNKHILFVCQYFYPEKISSGILPYELATELAKSNFLVSALVGYPQEYADTKIVSIRESIRGINVHRLKYKQYSRSSFFGRIMNYLSFCIAIWKKREEFKNIDMCICYTNPPLIPYIIAKLSKKYNFKLIFEIYDLYPDAAIKSGVMSKNSIMCKVLNYCTNYALKESDKIILLSNEMRRYLLDNKNIDNLENKSFVIPNWYQEIPTIKNQYSEVLTVLYGGNMGVMQDMDTLIKSVIELKDNNKIKFIFAGHGVKYQRIVDTKSEYSLQNLELLGFIPKKEYDKIMNSVDIAVVSLEEFAKGLGSPSKVYSYLAQGLPVIAIMPEDTDIINDIENSCNGISIRNGDYLKLCSALINLSNNINLLNEMAVNSKKLFETKYSLEVVKEKYFEILGD